MIWFNFIITSLTPRGLQVYGDKLHILYPKVYVKKPICN